MDEATDLVKTIMNTHTKLTDISRLLSKTWTVQNMSDKTLQLDKSLNMVSEMLDGKTMPREHYMTVSLSSLLVENVISVYNLLNPRIRKIITDQRLVNIIIKNTIGPNSDAFISLESSVLTDKSKAPARKDADSSKIAINSDVTLTETPNESLFPAVYQFGFCVSTVDAIIKKDLVWLGDVYKMTIPRIYTAHTPWTLLGGSLEISGYAPSAYGANERRGGMSEVSNHISNFKGIVVTMRKSDEAEFKRMVKAWCMAEDNLRPCTSFTWRENSWKTMVGYQRNALCQNILRCTDLFKTLLRSAQQMFRSNVRSFMCCLLYGPPGTGKTRTVFELANTIGYKLFSMSMVHDDADISNVRERQSIASQLAELSNITQPFVLLIDDIRIENGQFTDCTLSRPKLLSLFEGQGFPPKTIIIMASNNMNTSDMTQMYDGAMFRKGRVQLVESKTLSPGEKVRIKKCLRKTLYRGVQLGPITKICDLFSQMADAETDNDSDAESDTE